MVLFRIDWAATRCVGPRISAKSHQLDSPRAPRSYTLPVAALSTLVLLGSNAVPLVGVLMVFTMLVVPATIAFLFSRDIDKLVLISLGAGIVASLLGLIVCMYGVLLIVAGIVRRLSGRGSATPEPAS